MGIQWSEGMLIGHPVLDAQHNAIIRRINDFEVLIESGSEQTYLSQQYAAIVDCLSSHFIQEEQLMSAARYPGAERHISEHGDLFTNLSHMTLQIENNDPDIEEAILAFLHKWLFEHVMSFDRDFINFLNPGTIANEF